ncbi:MAG: antibiotic biosynthesis monooxygenase, partial [Erysipelotrichaceae bacterium]|nr:antibiotic biosynthesis monooxygenase [Erysipelotrichaceae bacterium]
EEIRNKEGNEGYSYYFPMEDEESVLLIDKWTNQQALDAHHQSDTMQKIMVLREKYDLHMQVHRYEEIEQEERDKKYIR